MQISSKSYKVNEKKLGMILTILFLFSAKMIQQWTEPDGLMFLKGQK